ncbi:MAG: acetoin utilization protein AcuC [Candidatus Nanopelagicales bacterium]
MSCRLAYVFDEALAAYDFGREHPLSPIRQRLTNALVHEFGILEQDNVSEVTHIKPVRGPILRRTHDDDYIAAVTACSDGVTTAELRGLGTPDVPVFLDMHRAASLICGASVAAVESVLTGNFDHGVNISGGLHHAMPDRAAGFCVYNDASIAIQWLLDAGFERVAYIDVDAHHGDGVQESFYEDPRVMTISIHESGRSLFPGTGPASDCGGPGAEGTCVNIELRAATSDSDWIRAFEAVVPDAIAAFKPQFIVSQQGCDSHRNDPLTNLMLSVDAQRWSYERIHQLSHEHCDGKWVALGGGGYDWPEVVPRAWTHLVAIAAGNPIAPDTAVPQSFRDLVFELSGVESPETMGDGVHLIIREFDGHLDPMSQLDRSILKTREAVFPHLGLKADPHGF